MRNDLSIYRTYAPLWWDESQRFLRLLHNLVPARLKYFDNIIDSWRDETVLDLGCGGGFMSEALANKGAKVIGVDPSEAAIAVAQDHAKQQGLAINYKVGTGENIPLPDRSRPSLSFTWAKRFFVSCREERTTQRNLSALQSFEKS
jgi:2-polyprenyl-6-hydroxyphenyl methylase / 3-demethylubiquinone-9 3-methyltransferase